MNFIKTYIVPALMAGVIEKTIPEKINNKTPFCEWRYLVLFNID